MIPVSTVLEADFAVVGGGIGGLMAAISAAESGAGKVLVLEKAHVRRILDPFRQSARAAYYECYLLAPVAQSLYVLRKLSAGKLLPLYAQGDYVPLCVL